MQAHELLTGLLETLSEAVPEADFQEAYGVEQASRRRSRPLAVGQVVQENLDEEWSAKLRFVLYLPGGSRPGEALQIAGAIVEKAAEEDLFAGASLGALLPEKALGGLAMECTLRFAQGNTGGAGSKATYLVRLNGEACRVTGWKETLGGKETVLTAMGEEEPFYRWARSEYTVELQGLNPQLAALEDFTLQVGEDPARLYTGCQWKSFSAAGTGVLSANQRTVITEN